MMRRAERKAGAEEPCVERRMRPKGAHKGKTHLRSPMSKEAFLAKLGVAPHASDKVEAPQSSPGPRIGNHMADDASRVTDRATHASEPPVGAVISDGTIFAGISPNTGKPMYTTPADTPLTYTFNEAAELAKKLNKEQYLGHDDWHVPTKEELRVLFNNRAAIGGFDESGDGYTGWYWSSDADHHDDAYSMRFSDGDTFHGYMSDRSSVRCVR